MAWNEPPILAALGLHPPLVIDTNPLLRDKEPAKTRGEVAAFKMLATLAKSQKIDRHAAGIDEIPDSVKNIATASDQDIDAIRDEFGETGLFKLLMLCMKETEADFNHFFKMSMDIVRWKRLFGSMHDDRNIPDYDNPALKASSKLDEFSHNIIQPSLSRKMYNTGRGNGFMVFGFGGPRILVSLPFHGAVGEMYDIYMNSIDVVTSLVMRGFYGTFLLLDKLPSLNFEVLGVPAWTLWFSKIAAHSDLVVFVKAENTEFRTQQQLEIDFTPDRVNKKIVNVGADELRWARKYENEDIPTEVWNILPDKGPVSIDEWNAVESKFARPFIEEYPRVGIPLDRLFVIDEQGSVREHPYPRR